MRSRFLILFSFAVLILSGTTNELFAEDRIKLHLGQTVSVNGLSFTLKGVEDSRCPSDVTCVWAGHVTVTVLIENQTQAKMIDFAPGDSSTFFSPYKITLLDVSPYPVSTEQASDHIVTFVMHGLDGKPPCEKHMIVKDGLCVPESPTPLDFRESGTSIHAVYAYSGIGLVGIVLGFFVIKKLKDRK